MPDQQASISMRAMLSRSSRQHLVRLTLLAFLLNATLPFYVSAAAEAAFALAGNKALLCTLRGYEWVDDSPAQAASDVIVISSPLDASDNADSNADQGANQDQNNTHASTHCSLCFIQPQQTALINAVLVFDGKRLEQKEQQQFISIQNQRYQQQHLLRLAPSRAPPFFA